MSSSSAAASSGWRSQRRCRRPAAAVTVVEAVDRLLGRAVAPVIASHVRQRLEATGVRILTGTTIARLEGENGHVSAAVTSAGERLPARMVIIGIGVVPNAELARSRRHRHRQRHPRRPADAHARCRKSSPSATPPPTGTGSPAATCGWNRCRTPPTRRVSPRAPSSAMPTPIAAVPWFWSDIGDMKLQMVGLTAGGDSHVVLGDLPENKFSIYPLCRQTGCSASRSVNRPGDHMLGRKMLGAGFSPTPQIVATGPDGLEGGARRLPAGRTCPRGGRVRTRMTPKIGPDCREGRCAAPGCCGVLRAAPPPDLWSGLPCTRGGRDAHAARTSRIELSRMSSASFMTPSWMVIGARKRMTLP